MKYENDLLIDKILVLPTFMLITLMYLYIHSNYYIFPNKHKHLKLINLELTFCEYFKLLRLLLFCNFVKYVEDVTEQKSFSF